MNFITKHKEICCEYETQFDYNNYILCKGDDYYKIRKFEYKFFIFLGIILLYSIIIVKRLLRALYGK